MRQVGYEVLQLEQFGNWLQEKHNELALLTKKYAKLKCSDSNLTCSLYILDRQCKYCSFDIVIRIKHIHWELIYLNFYDSKNQSMSEEYRQYSLVHPRKFCSLEKSKERSREKLN